MSTKIKKIPLRQCLGCNEHKPKQELLRVVRPSEDGQPVCLDMTGRKSGRGAYICRDIKCLHKARKSHRIETALNCGIPDDIYDAMEQELELYVNEQT